MTRTWGGSIPLVKSGVGALSYLVVLAEFTSEISFPDNDWGGVSILPVKSGAGVGGLS